MAGATLGQTEAELVIKGDLRHRLDPLLDLLSGELSSVFRSMHDSLSDGICCCEHDGRVVYCNAAYEAICGYRLEEIAGKRVYEYHFDQHGEDFAAFTAAQHRRYRDRQEGKSELYTLKINRPDGNKRDVEVRASPLRSADGTVVGSICVMTDVTERKLTERLIWSHKHEAVTRLAGSVGHDFNNLLTVIAGYAALLRQRVGEEERVRKPVEMIASATSAAYTLAYRLLAVSRNQLNRPEIIDLRDTVAAAERVLHGLIDGEITLEVSQTVQPLPMRIDPAQLQQVVLNLVVNARDAMSGNGRLRLQTGYVLCEGTEEAHGGLLKRGAYCMLEVSDTGPGIPEAMVARIFEPFFTTKPKGSGLGLPIVKSIVEQCGGGIQLVSFPGRGTRIRLYFPYIERQAKRATEVQRAPRHEPEEILVIEGEHTLRELVCDVLESEGYAVTSSAHVEEALSLLGRTNASPDLIIASTRCFRKDSSLRHQLMLRAPQARSFALGGSEAERESDEIWPEDLFLLRKPFAARDLLTGVRKALDEAPGRAG